MANLSFHPNALREYRIAVDWYQQRNATVARRFVAEVNRVLAQITLNPDRYSWYDDRFREAVLKRYPFSVVYRVLDSGTVQIVAISHSSREPGYWLERDSE